MICCCYSKLPPEHSATADKKQKGFNFFLGKTVQKTKTSENIKKKNSITTNLLSDQYAVNSFLLQAESVKQHQIGVFESRYCECVS